ncbi:MAG: MBL fold metallo-hydrolase [Thermoplasmata archaeon]
MEVAFLGSSSSGNSTLIFSEDTRVLIDAGLSAKEIERRIEFLGHSPEDVDAIVLTHEHTDHCRGAGIFARKYDVPIRANAPTIAMSPIGNARFEEFHTQEGFSIKDLRIIAFPVPHNAAEPVCFVISDHRHSIGFATDLGRITKMLSGVLFDKDLLIIEANHDEEMLRAGPYPEFLKRSIASPTGHLSNRQTATAAAELVTDRTKGIALVHLSEENNTPEKAEHTVKSALARRLKTTHIHAAERYRITEPISLK